MTTENLEQAKILKKKIDDLKQALSLLGGSSTRYKNTYFGIVGTSDDDSTNWKVDVLKEITDGETVSQLKEALEDRIKELEEEFARL